MDAQAQKCPVITIDGPAGVGKTTLARLLAKNLSLPCLDTGAMFRVIALKLGPEAATMPAARLNQEGRSLVFALAGCGETTQLLCNNTLIGNEIRTETIGLLASRVAQRPELRTLLATIQRRMGEAQPLVAEGRDMGTVVFPDAYYKFFLDAKPETRAKRRLHDQNSCDQTQDLETIIAKIKERDHLDRTRSVAPLKPAQDALILDTSDASPTEILNQMLNYIDSHGGRAIFARNA